MPTINQLVQEIASVIERPAGEKPSLTDYLRVELDKAVAACPSDEKRLRLLAVEAGNWMQRRQRFHLFGEHPFGGPPPGYEPMQAADFHVVLGMISSAQAAVKERMARRVDA